MPQPTLTIVPVVSFKGGAGKTTVALTLAVSAAQRDEHVHAVVLDLDLEGTDLRRALPGGLSKPERALNLSDYLTRVPVPDPERKASVPAKRLLWKLKSSDVGTDGRLWALPSQVDDRCLDEIQPILWSEAYSGHVLSMVLRLTSSFAGDILKRDQEAKIVVFIDCGPGLSAVAREALDLEPLLDYLWHPPKNHRLDPRFRRVLVSGPERQGLMATAEYLLERPRRLAEERGHKALTYAAKKKAEAEMVREFRQATWMLANRVAADSQDLAQYVSGHLKKTEEPVLEKEWNRFSGEPGSGTLGHLVIIPDDPLLSRFRYDFEDIKLGWPAIPAGKNSGLDRLIVDLVG